ncbi:helix-turn-helix domain-containing protein [Azospirillum aestuarii]|uniref:helix-turn-helix domain-containing protein n=1 Tax=Azospirillum aestuarii TaxID=2802052 RepID=UPI004054DEFD
MADHKLTDAQRAAALAAVDWARIDAMTDDDIARQIAANPDAPADLSDAPADALRVIHPSGGISVRGIRAKLNLSQRAFADRFGFPLGTLRDWEQGRSQPDAATRTLLFVIESAPELVAAVVARHAA